VVRGWKWRRLIGVLTAAVAAAVVLVPVGGGAEPAAAWARSGYACRTYPTTATLYIKYPPTVPATYRASLRKAAEAWSAWRYVTGVTITFGDLADPTPAGARVVGVASMPNIPGASGRSDVLRLPLRSACRWEYQHRHELHGFVFGDAAAAHLHP